MRQTVHRQWPCSTGTGNLRRWHRPPQPIAPTAKRVACVHLSMKPSQPPNRRNRRHDALPIPRVTAYLQRRRPRGPQAGGLVLLAQWSGSPNRPRRGPTWRASRQMLAAGLIGKSSAARMPGGRHSLGKVKTGVFGAHEIASFRGPYRASKLPTFYFRGRCVARSAACALRKKISRTGCPRFHLHQSRCVDRPT
jgi:hypothetical protein